MQFNAKRFRIFGDSEPFCSIVEKLNNIAYFRISLIKPEINKILMQNVITF